MTHLTQMSHVVIDQIINCLQFETCACPLRDFRVAKSTSFLSLIILCTLRFTHMQSLTAYFFNSVFMLKAILSIAVSSHEGHERFSEISRGRQCSFMSFSALLCAQSFPVQHWDTVDQILIEGDRMYLNALEGQGIPDTDTLSLIYLPNQARSTVQSPVMHWGHRTKSIGCWGNKIAFWGEQFKTIARWGKDYFKQITCYGDKHWSTHSGRARWSTNQCE